MSFVAQLTRTGALPVHFIQCEDIKGRSTYHLVRAPIHKIRALQAQESPVCDIAMYGDVLLSGFGDAPTPQTKAWIAEKYGVDMDKLLANSAHT